MNSQITDEYLDKECRLIASKTHLVELHETLIDPGQDLYLITWCPDPEHLPNSDFNIQHQFCMDTLSKYLEACEVGLFCVETTQLGRPHYHGWYQIAPDKRDLVRIIHAKVMSETGLLKITKSKGHYKIHSWNNKANCLYYYKKDLIQSMLTIETNPITKNMRSNIDWNSMVYSSFFHIKGKRQSIADLEDKLNLHKFYEQFYTNSLPEQD